MEVSCGFIIRTEKGILACHPTGREFGKNCYDVPKGHMEEGEEPLETAIRELKEETGIDYRTLKVKYFKPFRERAYRNRRIRLFYAEVENFPFDFDLHCISMVKKDDGTEFPENNAYKWTNDCDDFFKSLAPIIQDSLLEVRADRTKLECCNYRHIKTGKIYTLVQASFFVKDVLSNNWDKNNYVLYRARYENPDGPYFCRSKKSFIMDFEKISNDEAHVLLNSEKKRHPRIGEK